ncbi:hypothetical protein SEA_SCHMIDT_54 [Gordonia phage Schmidt]|uniref:Uncharacterized protein n=1 Tax=Gordonia phage Schmidt TaxID=2301697 RepID=A0A385E0H3_9CAUD|nr:hypothetical protein KDJ59_gp54 [Gordonia phage Schmidt]AXQ65174.1 hypothetical protein SEA_SCHMIDT_54 [Gordonia phage Schmidt]
MTSLRQLVTDTPEVIAALRSATVFGRMAPADDDGPDESRKVFSFGPKPPCDVDLIDWADREAAELVAIAEAVGRVRIAGVWRRGGQPLGLLYDDLRPVVLAAEVICGEFDRGWHDDQVEKRLRAVRRRTMRRFRWLESTFSADADEADQPDDGGQIGLHIV